MRVVITGSIGSGKSTLTKLVAKLNYHVGEEIAREFIAIQQQKAKDENIPTQDQLLPFPYCKKRDEFQFRLLEIYQANLTSLRHGSGIYFSDTCHLDPLTFLIANHNCPNPDAVEADPKIPLEDAYEIFQKTHDWMHKDKEYRPGMIPIDAIAILDQLPFYRTDAQREFEESYANALHDAKTKVFEEMYGYPIIRVPNYHENTKHFKDEHERITQATLLRFNHLLTELDKL